MASDLVRKINTARHIDVKRGRIRWNVLNGVVSQNLVVTPFQRVDIVKIGTAGESNDLDAMSLGQESKAECGLAACRANDNPLSRKVPIVLQIVIQKER